MTRDPRRRQLRQLRPHARRLPAASSAPRPRCVRNDDIAPTDAAARIADYDAVLVSPGPGTPATPASSIPIVRAALAAGIAAARRVPRAPGDRRGVRRDGRARRRAHARQDLARRARRQRALRRACRSRSARRATTRSRSSTATVPRRARGDEPHRTAGSSWGCATARRRSSACSSTPSPCSPRAATGCSATGSPSPGFAEAPPSARCDAQPAASKLRLSRAGVSRRSR